MSNELENTGKILIYQNEKGDTKIDVYFEEDTIWMTQRSHGRTISGNSAKHHFTH